MIDAATLWNTADLLAHSPVQSAPSGQLQEFVTRFHIISAG